MLDHFVRRRPARYPPIDELMICMRMTHTMAARVIVVAEAPMFDHGDTDDKPSPAPSASRMSESAAVTNAPPITAAHDTPDECASWKTAVLGSSV
jgi:hypothetical protein